MSSIDEKEKQIAAVYYGAKKSASFSGPQKVYQVLRKENSKISFGDVKRWFKKQEVYGSHKRIQRKFKRNKFVSFKSDYIWDADVCIMEKYKEYNRGYKNFLLVIDTFSRFTFTRMIKSNTGKDIKAAFQSFFKSSKRKPMKIRTDQGKEFNNSTVKNMLRTNKINYYTTQNTEIKAHFAERCIRTIKSKLIKYMHNSNTFKWIDKLKDITDSYNNTIHRSIKTTPASVKKEDEIKLWKLLYEDDEKSQNKPLNQFKFLVDDVVRISSIKRTFEKEYDVRWSTEQFIIASRHVKENIAKYVLKDFNNEIITGEFYEQELQRIYVDDKTMYKIEYVVKKRSRNGKKEVLVKWMGYNSSFNSWIPEENIVNFE